jgi:CPW-WPC domain-containing protein
MMSKFVLLGCIGVAFGASPAFPGGSGGATQAIAGALSSATGSSSYRSKQANEAAAISSAISVGSKSLAEAVASELALDALKKDSFIAAHFALRKQVHVGMCSRSWSGCPAGWAGTDVCAPGASYDGFCGARNLASMSTSQKEDFAFRCGVSWPCA